MLPEVSGIVGSRCRNCKHKFVTGQHVLRTQDGLAWLHEHCLDIAIRNDEPERTPERAKLALVETYATSPDAAEPEKK